MKLPQMYQGRVEGGHLMEILTSDRERESRSWAERDLPDSTQPRPAADDVELLQRNSRAGPLEPRGDRAKVNGTPGPKTCQALHRRATLPRHRFTALHGQGHVDPFGLEREVVSPIQKDDLPFLEGDP
jgi:hypothetical protein